MRVAMLLAKSDEFDTRVRKEAESLAATGHDVRVFSAAGDGLPREARERGVAYERVEIRRPFRDAWRRRRERLARPAPSLAYRAQVRAETFFYKRANVLARHLEVWRALRDPVAAFAPQVVHAHDLATLYAGQRIARALRVPLVYDAHELEHGSRRNRTPFDRRVVRLLERRGARAARAVITVAPEIAAELARAYRIPLPAVVLNSPPLGTRDLAPPFSLRERCGVGSDDIVLVYTGLLLPERGLREVAAALPLLPGTVHLVALGPREPAAEEQLLATARDLGVAGRVHVVDPVPSMLVPATIATGDVAVIPLPSHYRSYDLALPNKLFDAVLAGVPIVSSRVTSIAAFVREHDLGETFDLGEPQSIAGAVRAVTDRRPGGAGSSTLQEQVAWERQEAVLRSVYAGLA